MTGASGIRGANGHRNIAGVTTPFNPKRLLLEILFLVALAEAAVMLVLPTVAPDLGTLSQGLLDMSMLALLAGPAVYWRILVAFKTGSSSAPAPQPGTGKSRHAIALAAFAQILVLLLTMGGIWWQGNNLDAISHDRFDQSVKRIETEARQRLNQSFYGLRGARGAMASNVHFSRQQFRDYVASRDLPREFPGIRGFGFIERVQRPALARFVAETRADGAPEFAVHSNGSAADLFVVKYVEPQESNRVALGFDMGQEAVRRAALEYAMLTGEPTLLAGISLLQDAKLFPALLFLLPVYRKGSNPQTPEQRRQALVGLLYAPVVTSELLGSVATAADNLIDFELYDGPQPVKAKLIFYADEHLFAATGNHPATVRKFEADRVLNVGSQVLSLRASSSSQFELSQDSSSLTLIGAGGTLVSFLMAISVWLLASGRQRARDLAESMTAELDRMAQVVQHTDNAVTIMDRDMRIQWINQGFSRITGYSLEEAQGRTPGELLTSGKSLPEAIQTLLDGARHGVACRVELINPATTFNIESGYAHYPV